MLVPLTIIDGAVAEMDICCGFVYALPNGKDPRVAQTLIDNIEAATKRVVTKWPMLQGHPIWDKEARLWSLDVPTESEKPNLSRPFLFSSDIVKKPYHRAVGLDAPIKPLSHETTPCHVQPKHVLEHFRHPKLPSTFPGCSKMGASIVAVRVVVFDDALTVGVTVPHGCFDATGMGFIITALRAELHDEAVWPCGPPPPLFETNPADEQIRLLKAEPDSASKEVENSALPAWVSAGELTHVAKFLLNYVIEKKCHHDEPRHYFLSEKAINGLIAKTKKEVAEKTGGKEWISTGDVLNAWTLKALHSGEAKSGTSAMATPVFSLRDLLGFQSYPHNAVGPYTFSFTPIPLSKMAELSIADLALIHRRTLAECRARPYLTATLKKMDRLTDGGKVPFVPERHWPWKVAFARIKRNDKKGKKTPVHHTVISNQAVSDVAKLAIPAPVVAAPAPTTSDADSQVTASGTSTPVDAEFGEKAALKAADAADAAAAATLTDLPLLAYYMRITAPIKDHQSYRFQTNEKGIFMEGCMRRKRWACMTKAVEQLEREFGHTAVSA